MKKQLKGLLSLWLAVLLAASTLAVPAGAEGEDAVEVHKHGPQDFTELTNNTVFEANKGDLYYYLPVGGVKLIDDNGRKGINIPNGTNVTLCLNGQTLSNETVEGVVLSVGASNEQGGSLTICDCKDSGKVECEIVNYGNGSLTIEGGTILGPISAFDSGKLTIKGTVTGKLDVNLYNGGTLSSGGTIYETSLNSEEINYGPGNTIEGQVTVSDSETLVRWNIWGGRKGPSSGEVTLSSGPELKVPSGTPLKNKDSETDEGIVGFSKLFGHDHLVLEPVYGHTVTVNSDANGTVTADKAIAAADDIVTLTVTPGQGYELDTLTVIKTSDSTTVGVNGDQFTMPASDVTVTATFKLIPPEDNSPGGGYLPWCYIIHSSAGEGGSIDPEGRVTVTPGRDKTFSITPEEGYAIADVLVDGESLGPVESYTFEWVYRDHTIEALFEPRQENFGGGVGDCPRDHTCPIWPFTDAETTEWYHDGVHFCLEEGLMVGYGDNIFQPYTSTSRAMIAIMLWRLNGSPVFSSAPSFADVEEGKWYAESIRWAKAAGLVADVTDGGLFRPDDALTREDMVTILWCYAQHMGYDVSVGEETNILSFNDALTVSEYAIPAMQWACGSGLIIGEDDPDGSGMLLDPTGDTTRAEFATIMLRFCENIMK